MPTPKLGARPKTFKTPVTFELIEGGEATILCTFKYRTRTEFGQLIEEMFGKEVLKSLPDEKFNLSAVFDRETERHGDYLLKILDGWDLADDLTAATAQRFADEYPGGVLAAMEKYRKATMEGRLGN